MSGENSWMPKSQFSRSKRHVVKIVLVFIRGQSRVSWVREWLLKNRVQGTAFTFTTRTRNMDIRPKDHPRVILMLVRKRSLQSASPRDNHHNAAMRAAPHFCAEASTNL